MKKRRQQGRPSKKLQRQLKELETQLDAGAYQLVSEQLAALHRQHGDVRLLLEVAGEMCLVMGDAVGYIHYAQPLVTRQRGEERALTLTNLATCCIQLNYMGLGYHFAQLATQDHPDFYLDGQNQNLVNGLAETAADDEQMQALKAFPVAERLPLAAKMDEVRLRFAQGNLKGARDLAEAHLEAHPELHALRNLLALIYFEDNDLEAAIRCAEMVYLLAPENIPALANLVRFHHTSGAPDVAIQFAHTLNGLTPDHPDRYGEIIEANAFIGNSKQILRAYRHIRDSAVMEDAFLCHLVAVAAWYQDQFKRARKLWRRAVKLDPEFDLAQYCLEQLPLPAEVQDLGWYYPLTMWVPRPLAERLGYLLMARQEGTIARDAPELVAGLQALLRYDKLFPAMLIRGNLVIRQIVLWTIATAPSPERIEALVYYGMSPAGPDNIRAEAIRLVGELDPERLPAGSQILFWFEGEQRPLTIES